MFTCLWCWLFGHKFYFWTLRTDKTYDGCRLYKRLDCEQCQRCGITHELWLSVKKTQAEEY